MGVLLFTIDFTMVGPNRSRQMDWKGLLPKFNLSSGRAPICWVCSLWFLARQYTHFCTTFLANVKKAVIVRLPQRAKTSAANVQE